ncbi:MAG: type II toxin-antitoxin system VapC family toxin [Salinibacter sp.]|uniref:type II toxin-antitoxin system VapC family toxin n=1 Tax=Salinibacter sp. TaxID=2065818 RepID=UPI002FC3A38C
MKLLLDTYTLIYALARPDDLKEPAQTELADPENEVFFTPANVWEIEIKVSIGKLERPATDVVRAAQSSFTELLISSAHAATAGQLPMHHRDPFDRVIIAQGQEEGCTIVTPDDKFPLYDVDVIDG